jgi:MATE family multidrug resistance protein
MDKLSASRNAAAEFLSRLFAPSFATEAWDLLTVAGPLILGLFADHLVDIVDLIFLGRLGEDALAACALAILYMNVSALSLVMGMMGAMDTLVAQAFGARNYRRVGHVFQRALLIATLLTVPMLLLRVYARPVLTAIGFAPKVAAQAAVFLRTTLPAVPAVAYLDAFRRYLQAQNETVPVMAVTILGVVCTVVFNLLFVTWLGWGTTGVAYSHVVAMWAMCFAALGYIYCSGFYRKTWGGWSRAALRDWGEFLSYALPSTAMLCAEWWGLELQSAVSGLQGSAVLGAQSILFNIMVLVYMTSSAIAIATSARVGALLGSGKPAAARFAAQTACAVTVAIEAVIAVTVYMCSGHVSKIFTDSAPVQHALAAAMPLVCIYCFFDGIQGVFAGVLRGCGLQDIGFYLYTFAYWAVGLPLAYLLSLKVGSHLKPVPVSDVADMVAAATAAAATTAAGANGAPAATVLRHVFTGNATVAAAVGLAAGDLASEHAADAALARGDTVVYLRTFELAEVSSPGLGIAGQWMALIVCVAVIVATLAYFFITLDWDEQARVVAEREEEERAENDALVASLGNRSITASPSGSLTPDDWDDRYGQELRKLRQREAGYGALQDE